MEQPFVNPLVKSTCLSQENKLGCATQIFEKVKKTTALIDLKSGLDELDPKRTQGRFCPATESIRPCSVYLGVAALYMSKKAQLMARGVADVAEANEFTKLSEKAEILSSFYHQSIFVRLRFNGQDMSQSNKPQLKLNELLPLPVLPVKPTPDETVQTSSGKTEPILPSLPVVYIWQFHQHLTQLLENGSIMESIELLQKIVINNTYASDIPHISDLDIANAALAVAFVAQKLALKKRTTNPTGLDEISNLHEQALTALDFAIRFTNDPIMKGIRHIERELIADDLSQTWVKLAKSDLESLDEPISIGSDLISAMPSSSVYFVTAASQSLVNEPSSVSVTDSVDWDNSSQVYLNSD